MFTFRIYKKSTIKTLWICEKCDKDLDCKSNKCTEGLCDFELDCNKLCCQGVGMISCLALNEGLDKLYYWQNGECNVNPCNENTYGMCDEGGCEDLHHIDLNMILKKQCIEVINKQGESNTEPTSMAKIYQEYVDEGGYDNVCKDFDDTKKPVK